MKLREAASALNLCALAEGRLVELASLEWDCFSTSEIQQERVEGQMSPGLEGFMEMKSLLLPYRTDLLNPYPSGNAYTHKANGDNDIIKRNAF